MGDYVFCTFYLLLFSFIVLKANLFKLPGLSNRYTLFAFYLKLLFGIALWYIYTYHYKNRDTSDIFKYYDDGKLMFQTIHTGFGNFLKMFTGIGDSSPEIQGYYHSMKSWINGHDSTLYNNSHFIIRFNALLMFFSGGHYTVYIIAMCFIALCGLCYLYKTFYPFLPDTPKLLFAAVFLFPSVLMWSSGDLKEVFVFLGLGLSIYYFKKLLANNGNNLANLLLVLFAFVLIFESKAYIFLCILPCFIAEFLVSKLKIANRFTWLTYIIVTSLYLLIGLNINKVYPSVNPIATLSDKQQEFMRLAKGGIYLAVASDETQYAYIPVEDSVNILPANPYADSLLHKHGIQYLCSAAFCYKEEQAKKIAPYWLKAGQPFDLIRHRTEDTLHLIANDSTVYRLDTYIETAKSRIDVPLLKPTFSGLIAYIPTALTNTLFRPYPHELHSSATIIVFAENVIFLLLGFFAFAFMRRNNPNRNMVAFCLSYCLLMLVLIGISTPLYGGIERYKSVVIPFMLILLLLIYDKDKFKRTLKK